MSDREVIAKANRGVDAMRKSFIGRINRMSQTDPEARALARRWIRTWQSIHLLCPCGGDYVLPIKGNKAPKSFPTPWCETCHELMCDRKSYFIRKRAVCWAVFHDDFREKLFPYRTDGKIAA